MFWYAQMNKSRPSTTDNEKENKEKNIISFEGERSGGVR
jgi:hypothetical protein